MALVLVGLVLFSTTLPAACRARAVVGREVGVSGLYAPGVSALAVLCAEAPWVAACASVSCGIVYPLVAGAPTPATSNPAAASGFYAFWGASVLFALCANTLALVLAYASPTLHLAQTLGYLVQAVFILFGGLLVPAPAVPGGWAWLLAASPLSHAAQAVWTSFFFCNSTQAGSGCRTFFQHPVPSPIVEWDFVAGWLGLQGKGVREELCTLVIFLAVYSAVAVGAAQTFSFIQR